MLRRRRTGERHGRLGVLASLCFPSFPTISGALFTYRGDRDVSEAMVRAYNDWHIEDWCGRHPDRFIPMGILPLWDASLAAAEVRRLAGGAVAR